MRRGTRHPAWRRLLGPRLAAPLLALPLLVGGRAWADAGADAPPAPARTAPAAGQYATEGGAGVLRLRPLPGEAALQLRLDSLGPNGQFCSLRARLDGETATTEPPEGAAPERACRLRLSPRADGLAVAIEGGDCQRFCGERARFTGDYLRLPAGCSPLQREERHGRALQAHREEQDAAAQQQLGALLQQCQRYTDWMELDQWRVDLALIALYRNQREDCLRWIDQTRAGALDEAGLQAALEPNDFKAYWPVAQLAWRRARQCGR